MNFIDISSWQAGLDLNTMFESNPLDGVIIKATEGRTYTNPQFPNWAKWMQSNNKPLGLYHFCDGFDANTEAEFFYSEVKSYIGSAVMVADYESPATSKGTAWLKTFLDRFYELSGIRCVVYCSLSVISQQDWSAIAPNHKLWVAQYADMNPVQGFLDNPWQSGSVSPFNGYILHQYTSCGQLNGWQGGLDLDKCYISADEWFALAKSTAPSNDKTSGKLKPADAKVVASVLAGKYGNGVAFRTLALRIAGYDPIDVQNKINELYAIASKLKPIVGDNTAYLDSIVYILTNGG